MRTTPDLDDPIGGFFWRNAAEGRLTAQRCMACDTVQHPAAAVCRACRDSTFAIDELPHDGRLAAYVIPRRPAGAVEPGMIIAVVELDPAIRIVTNLVDADESDVRVGMPVTICFTTIDGVTLPTFRPLA